MARWCIAWRRIARHRHGTTQGWWSEHRWGGPCMWRIGSWPIRRRKTAGIKVHPWGREAWRPHRRGWRRWSASKRGWRQCHQCRTFAQEPWASWALAAQQRMTALRAAQVAWEASPFSWHPQSLQEAGRLCRGEAAENRHWERLRHRAAFCERIQRCLWSHQLAPEG